MVAWMAARMAVRMAARTVEKKACEKVVMLAWCVVLAKGRLWAVWMAPLWDERSALLLVALLERHEVGLKVSQMVISLVRTKEKELVAQLVAQLVDLWVD